MPQRLVPHRVDPPQAPRKRRGGPGGRWVRVGHHQWHVQRLGQVYGLEGEEVGDQQSRGTVAAVMAVAGVDAGLQMGLGP